MFETMIPRRVLGQLCVLVVGAPLLWAWSLVGCQKPAEPAPEVLKSKPSANLVECPACSNGCAKNADTCPQCGYSFYKARIQAAREQKIAEQARIAKQLQDAADAEVIAARRADERETAAIRASEQTAIDATEKAGGKITRGANGINLLRIDLSNSAATVHTLRDIDWAHLTYLVWLNLSNTKIDDSDLKEIAALPDIGEIDLRGSRCTDAGTAWARQKWPRATILTDK